MSIRAEISLNNYEWFQDFMSSEWGFWNANRKDFLDYIDDKGKEILRDTIPGKWPMLRDSVKSHRFSGPLMEYGVHWEADACDPEGNRYDMLLQPWFAGYAIEKGKKVPLAFAGYKGEKQLFKREERREEMGKFPFYTYAARQIEQEAVRKINEYIRAKAEPPVEKVGLLKAGPEAVGPAPKAPGPRVRIETTEEFVGKQFKRYTEMTGRRPDLEGDWDKFAWFKQTEEKTRMISLLNASLRAATTPAQREALFQYQANVEENKYYKGWLPYTKLRTVKELKEKLAGKPMVKTWRAMAEQKAKRTIENELRRIAGQPIEKKPKPGKPMEYHPPRPTMPGFRPSREIRRERKLVERTIPSYQAKEIIGTMRKPAETAAAATRWRERIEKVRRKKA